MAQLALLLKTGDIVHIFLKHYREGDPKREFDAKITEVHNSIEYGVQISYERTDGIVDKMNSCHASHITHIVDAAPLVPSPRKEPENIFARRSWNACEKHGGIMVGHPEALFGLALGKVKGVELITWFHKERTKALYAKAGWPGMTVFPDLDEWEIGVGIVAVRWKPFVNWVRKNAHRLVYTVKEQRRACEEMDREAFEESMNDLDEIMDRQLSSHRSEYTAYSMHDITREQGYDIFPEDL